jgi:hypothetical protein
MSDDWLKDDPFANPDDPAAREREQRRREREEKRQQKAAKEVKPEPPAPPPPPPQPEPPKRTPEQEFWDDEPEPELTPQPVAAAPIVAEPEFHDEGDPAMAGAAQNGRRAGDGGRGRRSGFLGAIARHPFRLFAVIAAIFVLWFLSALFQPFHGNGSGHVQVTIPKGSSVSEVGDLLSDKGVIDNSTLFQVRVTLAGKRSEIYSGHFTLAHGMSYGAAIDATIRFATGNYTKPLTESELAIDSPYNSRTNAGLPPGPINSPGLEAIEAAAHPAQTGYLFYVTTPNACGKLTFAKTEAEFEAAVDKYNSAREAAGGNSPDTCGE